MSLPIQLISTDFDGTLHAEFEDPPVPRRLELFLGALQQRGAKWVINTGRDLPSLMESLARARLTIRPDYLVLVEREIYVHEGAQYVPLREWNAECERLHTTLFEQVRGDLPALVRWVSVRFDAMIYEDAYSPLCLVARSAADAEAICGHLEDYCTRIPGLSVVRNDIYARFSHESYNKGAALAEIMRRLGLGAEQVFAAGDHLNDLPMLSKSLARWLVAPANAVEPVKQAVRSQGGMVADGPWGHGVSDALERVLRDAGIELGLANAAEV
jgi:hypothetical protein